MSQNLRAALGYAERAPFDRIPRPPVPDLRRWYLDDEMTLQEIASAVGCSQGTVSKWVREAGIPRRPAARRVKDVAEKLRSLVVIDQANGCHVYQGFTNDEGYGLIRAFGRTRGAHIVAYELANGPVSEGLVLDHLCRNPPCVNVAHLEAVTNRENILRGVAPPAANARKTHCRHGHAFDAENTSVATSPSKRERRCRACAAARQRKYKARLRAQRDAA